MIMMKALRTLYIIITYYEKIIHVEQTPVLTQDKLCICYGNHNRLNTQPINWSN